ncbi:MAG: metallophosphoesterase [Pseudomonadota bacterium]|nr:metallophosphoesterase [Pseudomonadota bacterium]
MIIAQISDSHIDPESDKLEDRLRDLYWVVNDINKLNPAPDIIIHTGDVVHNGTQEKYDLALTILGDIQAPLHVCAGNRDDKNLIATNFQTGHYVSSSSEFLQYSIDNYPVRLIAVDTTCSTTNMGYYCQERAEILNLMLAEEPQKPTVIFMHHPPFEIKESKYPFQFDDWNTVDHLARVLKKHNQVKKIFCGHSHRNSSGEIAGIPANTVSSIAIDLRLGDVPEGAEFAPVYTTHTFDGIRFNSQTMVCSMLK